jgi:methylated-DNA-[protein]-cysteine S-methyltransferase
MRQVWKGCNLTLKTTVLNKNNLFIKITEQNNNIVEIKLSLKPFKNVKKNNSPLLKKAVRQISEYLSGRLTTFNLPLTLTGTQFQKTVWEETYNIPFGKTLTYKELAIKSGCPNGARAVGNALGKNPVPIVIPCHRILAANNKIGGFTGGTEIKKLLLQIENINFNI